MKPFMTHIVAGYPNIETSKQMLEFMIAEKVSAIEIQIPFSDPSADGPILMRANEHAVNHGNGRNQVLELIESVDFKDTTCLIMCYYQSLFYSDTADFIRQAIDKGCDGFIVPDLPFDSLDMHSLIADNPDLKTRIIPVVSPGISRERLNLLSQTLAPEIIYLTARPGTTGLDTAFSDSLRRTSKEINQAFPDAKLAIGFGIKSSADARQVLVSAGSARFAY